LKRLRRGEFYVIEDEEPGVHGHYRKGDGKGPADSVGPDDTPRRDSFPILSASEPILPLDLTFSPESVPEYRPPSEESSGSWASWMRKRGRTN
jgi:hypothetical protein